MTAARNYQDALSTLDGAHPRLQAVLRRAEERRSGQVERLHGGARFRGLEALLTHLADIARAFAAEPLLARLTFLVERGSADFETAIEATLSGYVTVAVDAMRDVMEIENLLLDFSVRPENAEEWLTCEARQRRRLYAPVAVRNRLHAARVAGYVDSAESADYRAHSASLHVSPHLHPIANKGFCVDDGFRGDAGFWELFEHARRLLIALRQLVCSTCRDSPLAGIVASDPPAIVDAWRKTQEWQSLFLAMLQTTPTSEDDSNDDALVNLEPTLL